MKTREDRGVDGHDWQMKKRPRLNGGIFVFYVGYAEVGAPSSRSSNSGLTSPERRGRGFVKLICLRSPLMTSSGIIA